MWSEDITVYENHKQLCQNEIDRIKRDFERAGHKVPMSYQGKLYDLEQTIKEYDEDIKKLRKKLSEL